MADGNAAAWTFLSAVRAVGSRAQAMAGVPSFGDARFPIRIQPEVDIAARCAGCGSCLHPSTGGGGLLG